MRKYGDIRHSFFEPVPVWGRYIQRMLQKREESLQITQEELLDEFDFSDLDDSLKKMFPREKMTFRDVVETLVSGDLKKAGEQFTGFLFDQFFYETADTPETSGISDFDRSDCCGVCKFFRRLRRTSGFRDCVLYSLYAAYRTLSERVSIGSIRDGGFVKLPAGIYEGALSDVFF